MKKYPNPGHRCVKTYWVLTAIFVLILHACGTAPGVKQGDHYAGQKDYLQAIRAYEQALSETQSEKKQNEITGKIETAKAALAQQTIDRARDRYEALGTPEVPDVEAIIAMGKSLGLKVVAEGVETKEQYRFLRKRNCEYLQGFYFGKPMPAQELLTWMEKRDEAAEK